MKRLKPAVILLAVAALPVVSQLSSAQTVMVYKTDTIIDVTYVKARPLAVKLDIAWPSKGGPYPIIVYFHGGGWVMGDKSMFRHRMMLLAQSGYVVFNANYRLAPESQFPTQVNDALGAVLFAKDQAVHYNGDPTRVAVMGDSAGAYLSAMVSLAWDDPYFQPSYKSTKGYEPNAQAAVLMYGGYRLQEAWDYNPKLWGTVATRPMMLAYMGGTPEQKPKEYEKASLSSYLGRDDIPPLFILCGTKDAIYPESLWLDKELNKKGTPHVAYFVEEAEHEFNYLEARTDFPYLRVILDFLDRELDNDRMAEIEQGADN